MILTCPACGTSYSVKDGAIPPQGRNVRCAACKHSWHQDGEEPTATLVAEPSDPAAPTGASAIASAPVEEPGPEIVDHQAPARPEIGETETIPPEPDPSPAVEAVPDEAPVPIEQDPGFAADAPIDAVAAATVVESRSEEPVWNDAGYDVAEPPAPRRRGLVIVLVLILVVAALAAAAWFFAPREWMARVGVVSASSDSPLKLMVTSQDRQKLASGNDLVSLSGRVINPTDSTQAVPALQADLRDGGGKLVYSWTIAPPTARLAPRASASFNAAELGVPADATSLTLRWAS